MSKKRHVDGMTQVCKRFDDTEVDISDARVIKLIKMVLSVSLS